MNHRIIPSVCEYVPHSELHDAVVEVAEAIHVLRGEGVGVRGGDGRLMEVGHMSGMSSSAKCSGLRTIVRLSGHRECIRTRALGGRTCSDVVVPSSDEIDPTANPIDVLMDTIAGTQQTGCREVELFPGCWVQYTPTQICADSTGFCIHDIQYIEKGPGVAYRTDNDSEYATRTNTRIPIIIDDIRLRSIMRVNCSHIDEVSCEHVSRLLRKLGFDPDTSDTRILVCPSDMKTFFSTPCPMPIRACCKTVTNPSSMCGRLQLKSIIDALSVPEPDSSCGVVFLMHDVPPTCALASGCLPLIVVQKKM